jgi:glycolate oxidase iron-sulfur subunit
MSALRTSRLAALDYSVVQQCMHCGLCLPTCPTYEATLAERHSPRGRIALMRAIADGRFEANRAFGEELYYCLGCLACTTACPAGVDYAHLFEQARAEVEECGALRNPRRNVIRSLTVGWLFMDLRRLRAVGRLIRAYQRWGIQRLIRASGVLRWLPRRLQELEAMTPEIEPAFSETLIPPVLPAAPPQRHRVALLIGCAQDLLFSRINRDTAEVLAAHHCEVVTPRNQSCCGSLQAHNGELGLAAHLARRNIDQFPPESFDAIITNAGGCGSHLKHYARLLHDDPAYRERARAWDRKVQDIHEWLMTIGVRAPAAAPAGWGAVTYHESCHLAHGQGITREPRELLRCIPGVKLVELPESSWCCGSAGIYNLTQPDMAQALLRRKLDHLQSTGATTVATANPGCLLQLILGAGQRGLRLRVVHPVSLLAEAYRAAPAPPPASSEP